MTLKEFFLKIKKRIDYFLANKKSIETYYMTVEASSFHETKFKYYNHILYARLKGSSDYDAINQVLVKNEYSIPKSYLSMQKSPPKHIIDAGSNIGTTAIYFKRFFPDSTIYCIEPDTDNFVMLKRNLDNYINNNGVVLYKCGLLGESGKNLTITSNFGDKRDWAKQVEIINEESVLKSITIKEIIEDNNIDILDLLKIDIEGAESFLLEPNTNLSFLEKTKCIALEIHDEYNIREKLYQLLINHHFIIIDDKQTTIAFNKKF